jgi:hypothetical protein
VVCYYLPERAVVAPGSTKSVYQWRQHPDDKAEVFRQLGLKVEGAWSVMKNSLGHRRNTNEES